MINHNQASDLIRTEAARIVTEGGLVQADQGETVERAAIKALQWAWCQAVRAEWQAFVDADPELKAQHAVALELMREDGYGEDRMPDPICMPPDRKPLIAKVENQEAVCVDYCMTQVTPLSALYTNKVRLVQSAAARVAKVLAEESVKTPPEWPITIASGETFNSIEEMEQCPIDAVKDMAKMMRDEDRTARLIREGIPVVAAVNERVRHEYGAEERAIRDALQPEPPAEAHDAPLVDWLGVPIQWSKMGAPPTPPTCWQYFGFDGPVGLDRLQKAYLGKVECESTPTVANAKLAGEAHRQYQNCLKDLANTMSAPPVRTLGDDDAFSDGETC